MYFNCIYTWIFTFFLYVWFLHPSSSCSHLLKCLVFLMKKKMKINRIRFAWNCNMVYGFKCPLVFIYEEYNIQFMQNKNNVFFFCFVSSHVIQFFFCASKIVFLCVAPRSNNKINAIDRLQSNLYDFVLYFFMCVKMNWLIFWVNLCVARRILLVFHYNVRILFYWCGCNFNIIFFLSIYIGQLGSQYFMFLLCVSVFL